MKLDVDNYQLTKDLIVLREDAIESVSHFASLRKQVTVAETKLSCSDDAYSKCNKKLDDLQGRYNGLKIKFSNLSQLYIGRGGSLNHLPGRTSQSQYSTTSHMSSKKVSRRCSVNIPTEVVGTEPSPSVSALSSNTQNAPYPGSTFYDFKLARRTSVKASKPSTNSSLPVCKKRPNSDANKLIDSNKKIKPCSSSVEQHDDKIISELLHESVNRAKSSTEDPNLNNNATEAKNNIPEESSTSNIDTSHVVTASNSVIHMSSNSEQDECCKASKDSFSVNPDNSTLINSKSVASEVILISDSNSKGSTHNKKENAITKEKNSITKKRSKMNDTSQSVTSLLSTSNYHENVAEEDIVDYSSDNESNDSDSGDHVSDTMTDNKFVTLVLKDYEANITKSRLHLTKNFHMTKYVTKSRKNITDIVKKTKTLFDSIMKRLKYPTNDCDMFPYVNFLSGLVSNYLFDDGFISSKITSSSFSCPCSKMYTEWYKLLNIEETICVATKTHSFSNSKSLIDHICAGATGEGSGFDDRGGDLYHYLTLCYISAKHGDAVIGPRGVSVLTGRKMTKQQKNKKKSHNPSIQSRLNAHNNELRRSERGNFTRVSSHRK